MGSPQFDYETLFDRALRAGTPEECAACIAEIAAALELAGDPADRARLLMCRARVHSNQWRSAEVYADTRAAMELFESAGERELALDAASWAAAHASRLGELAVASELTTESILALDWVTDGRLRMETFNRLGIFCISFLDYERAIEQFELSLAAAERLGDADKISRQLHNIADALLLQARHARLLQSGTGAPELSRAERALSRLGAEASEDFLRRSGADRLQAELLCELGLLDEALRVIEAALSRVGGIPVAAQRAAFAWIHARCLRLAGRATEALIQAQKAVALAAETDDHHELMLALDELAACQQAAGETLAALATGRRVNALMWRIHQSQTRQLVNEVWARADLVKERRQFESRAAEASRSAELDALTGIGNRRLLERFLRDASARQDDVAVIIVDLDHFKQVNDGFGHETGDAVLRRIAALLSAQARTGQVAIRFGGDEFLLGLPNVTTELAGALAHRLHQAVQHESWGALAPELSVTASLGVASGAASCWQAVMSAADAALYDAKQNGRNAIGAPGGRHGEAQPSFVA